ncbi:MAG: VOC family protein [Hyphomicrobiaceae bacterium]|jgi:catechol 2,3-dioxygenase-like lactoylglutathione lyase family enzyme|nr:VOC family protein [Methyloceanibacter sp.]MDX2317306.1 VOC family protein [Hyphomicrobiaceae bacterium]MDX2449328.1 VOC family protein [Hyphomicrobiaceae bacterium]
MPVTRLLRVSITVADLAGTAAFYRDWLGLDVGPEQSLGDPAWADLLGLEPDSTARAVDIMVGGHAIKLVAFDPLGQPYPAMRASNDQWFEHVALVAGDMTAAWERLEGGTPGEVTIGAPVLLPPNTGSVTAFKFRDPEGHPLELISFPKGVGAPVWHQTPGSGILGYDHTAISVMDMERSVDFYTGLLGFHIGGRSLNQGPEQDRLDELPACEVDVVALQPSEVATPHVELLHYRTPLGRTLTAPVNANDVAAARQVHQVDDLETLAKRLKEADVPIVSSGIVTLKAGGRAASVRDPDGHMIVLKGN